MGRTWAALDFIGAFASTILLEVIISVIVIIDHSKLFASAFRNRGLADPSLLFVQRLE